MTKPKKRKAAKPWRDPHDWYCEDAEPVNSLFAHWHFADGSVYDPCCGRGNIPEVAKLWGFDTGATDLIDRGYDDFACTFDFLTEYPLGTSPEHIIMNPPYSYQKGICEAFIRKALTVASHTVCVLVPTGFLHSNERCHWFGHEQPPTQIAYLSARPSMPPGAKISELGTKAFKGGKTNYVWLIYDLKNPAPLPPVWLPKYGNIA